MFDCSKNSKESLLMCACRKIKKPHVHSISTRGSLCNLSRSQMGGGQKVTTYSAQRSRRTATPAFTPPDGEAGSRVSPYLPVKPDDVLLRLLANHLDAGA